MPIKRTRPESEIQALADQFAEAANSSQTVMGWLRQNERKISDLIHEEGWCWSDIGRALDRAGIAYATGKPWDGTILRNKAAKARAQNARAEAKRTTRESSTALGGSLRFEKVGKVFVTMTDPDKRQIPLAFDPEPEAKPAPVPRPARTPEPVPAATQPPPAPDSSADDDGFQFTTVSFAGGKAAPAPDVAERKKTPPARPIKKSADEVLKTLFAEKG